MALIKSIAGVRGTIGGQAGENLTPVDIINIIAAFGQQVVGLGNKKLVVIGRDARPSGVFISQLVTATLQSLGIGVIDLGLTTTPTVGLAVPQLKAAGGVVITASHNPANWNALKLFNKAGEYLSANMANKVFAKAKKKDYEFATIEKISNYYYQMDYIDQHIEQILALPLVDTMAIKKRKFKVVVEAVNSTGGIAVPKLLQALGIDFLPLHCTPTGIFPHDPEPITENLVDLIATLQQGSYDLGIAVDPDVDRLVIIDEKGDPWGEDYTLVAVADYVITHTPGNVVSNIASSSALAVLAHGHGYDYHASPVGEMHVVAAMKFNGAVIGGEGNGGIIYPPLHYGRDALVGIALLLSYLAKAEKSASELRKKYPGYVLLKHKVQLKGGINPIKILLLLQQIYQSYAISTREGLKVILKNGWFHIRQSNTEPIMRIHIEGDDQECADAIAKSVYQAIETHFPNALKRL